MESMPRRLALAVLALCVGAAGVVGCGAPGGQAGEEAVEAAGEAGEAPEEKTEGEETPIPSRQAEMSRDDYSKPQEVYDFLDIDAGDQVVDLLAGGGYNTYLLAQRVGPEGMVYAEGASDGLRARLAEGDLAGAGNVELVADLGELPDGQLDAAVLVRAYHLMEDYERGLAELYRALKPGGTVGIVEVRSNQPEGHDMTTHRLGEQTVIQDLTDAGFELVAESDMLRRDDDDYTVYVEEGETRYMTDRMLLKFGKPGAEATATESD